MSEVTSTKETGANPAVEILRAADIRSPTSGPTPHPLFRPSAASLLQRPLRPGLRYDHFDVGAR